MDSFLWFRWSINLSFTNQLTKPDANVLPCTGGCERPSHGAGSWLGAFVEDCEIMIIYEKPVATLAGELTRHAKFGQQLDG